LQALITDDKDRGRTPSHTGMTSSCQHCHPHLHAPTADQRLKQCLERHAMPYATEQLKRRHGLCYRFSTEPTHPHPPLPSHASPPSDSYSERMNMTSLDLAFLDIMHAFGIDAVLEDAGTHRPGRGDPLLHTRRSSGYNPLSLRWTNIHRSASVSYGECLSMCSSTHVVRAGAAPPLLPRGLRRCRVRLMPRSFM
jgi:hypothetical protein